MEWAPVREPAGRLPVEAIRNKLDGHATEVSNSKNPSRTVVAKITVQPGAKFPWHTHPGPVIVNVAQGELSCIDAATNTVAEILDLGRTGQAAGLAIGHSSLWAGDYAGKSVLRIGL